MHSNQLPTSSRTLHEWVLVYDQIISERRITTKTRNDKRLWLRYLVAEFGDRLIDEVMPFEIAGLARKIAATGKQTSARRVVIEAKDLFYEALLHGWIYRNPADSVRPIKAEVKRQRLSLDLWNQMHAQVEHDSIHQRLLRLALVSAQRRSDLCVMKFDQISDGHLHVHQLKTGRRIKIPLALRLDICGLCLADVIEECRSLAKGSAYLLPMRSGAPSQVHRLSYLFSQCRKKILPTIQLAEGRTLPSLHEIRSLAERLYRYQGVDTQVLLGHKYPAITNLYNDDRGLSSGEWHTVRLRMPT